MRKPDYTSLDLVVIGALRDLQAASQQMLFLPMRQHALMSGWGGPPQTRTLAAQCATTLTTTISYRVPPGVTHIDVEVMASGNGSVTLSTAMDATGVALWFVDAFTAATDADLAVDVRANGLRMLAAPVWEWTDVDITVAMTGVLATYSMTIYPTHVPRAPTLAAYYESLVGDGTSYLEASTNLAARYMLPGTGSVASFTLLAWVAQLDGDGRYIAQVGDDAADSIAFISAGERAEHLARVRRAGSSVASEAAYFPDDATYALVELALTPTSMTVYVNGVTEGVNALSGSFATPADLFRLIDGGGGPARIRNIAIMPGALTSDERTALLAAQYRHDYRTSYDDGAGHVWAGRTPPFLWCTPAILHSPIHIYTAEPGETIGASGYTTMPDPENAAFGVWFRVLNSGDGFIARETGAPFDGLNITTNNGTVFDMDYADVELGGGGGAFEVGRWYLYVANSLGSEITVDIDDSDYPGVFSGHLDGNFTLGNLAGFSTDLDVEFAQPFYAPRWLTVPERAALYGAGHLHPVNEASGAWPALALPIVYQAGLTGSVVDNGGNGAAHPMSFTGTPNAVPSGPVASVVNSGDGGECDLNLIGDTTSDED